MGFGLGVHFGVLVSGVLGLGLGWFLGCEFWSAGVRFAKVSFWLPIFDPMPCEFLDFSRFLNKEFGLWTMNSGSKF